MGSSLQEHVLERSIPEPTSGCWLWEPSLDRKGYGQSYALGRKKPDRAHRIAWLAFRGDPRSLHVLHRCDNPGCVNPEHLYLGTHQDNMRDKMHKRRHAFGSRNGQAKLVESDISAIRRLRAEGHKLADIAGRFGVAFQTISKIARHDRRTHGG